MTKTSGAVNLPNSLEDSVPKDAGERIFVLALYLPDICDHD
jgi:hypothetical protein